MLLVSPPDQSPRPTLESIAALRGSVSGHAARLKRLGTMKYLLIILFVLEAIATSSLVADEGRAESSVKSFDDYVKLRYMPSRADFRNKMPVTELKSESHTIVVISDGKVMGTNKSIKQIYDRAVILKNKGITSNQRDFHVSTKKIEVSYMGETVSLEYAGNSNSEKYLQYEKEWLELYSYVYRYLTKNLIP